MHINIRVDDYLLKNVLRLFQRDSRAAGNQRAANVCPLRRQPFNHTFQNAESLFPDKRKILAHSGEVVVGIPQKFQIVKSDNGNVVGDFFAPVAKLVDEPNSHHIRCTNNRGEFLRLKIIRRVNASLACIIAEIGQIVSIFYPVFRKPMDIPSQTLCTDKGLPFSAKECDLLMTERYKIIDGVFCGTNIFTANTRNQIVISKIIIQQDEGIFR